MNQKTISFCLSALTAVLIGGSIASEGKGSDTLGSGSNKNAEIRIPGYYVLGVDPDNVNLTNYLRVIGFSEDDQKAIRDTKLALITIQNVEGNRWNMKRLGKNKTFFDMTFESGKEFETEYPIGRKVNDTITVDMEGKQILRLLKMGGWASTQTYKFSKEGFNLTMRAKEVISTVPYNRWNPNFRGDLEGAKALIFGK